MLVLCAFHFLPLAIEIHWRIDGGRECERVVSGLGEEGKTIAGGWCWCWTAHQSTRNYVCKFEVCTYNVDGSIKADIYVNSP